MGGKSNANIRLGILWFSPWLQMTGGFFVFGDLAGGFYGKTTGRTGGKKTMVAKLPPYQQFLMVWDAY